MLLIRHTSRHHHTHSVTDGRSPGSKCLQQSRQYDSHTVQVNAIFTILGMSCSRHLHYLLPIVSAVTSYTTLLSLSPSTLHGIYCTIPCGESFALLLLTKGSCSRVIQYCILHESNSISVNTVPRAVTSVIHTVNRDQQFLINTPSRSLHLSLSLSLSHSSCLLTE